MTAHLSVDESCVNWMHNCKVTPLALESMCSPSVVPPRKVLPIISLSLNDKDKNITA